MRLNIIGDTKSITGYGTHTRELIKAINELGVETYQADDIGSPCLIISIPNQWQYRSGNRHKPLIAYVIYEGEDLPKHWVELINEPYIDKLIVPSTYVKDLIVKAGITKPVTVAHHGVDTKLFNPKAKPYDKLKKDRFNFLMLGGWAQGVIDRKGFQYAIKAFVEEFKDDEPVDLFIKVNMTYNPNLDLKKELIKLKLPKNKKAITFLPLPMPYELLPRVYNSADCFIAPSMADAYNIPTLEAMACGLPVIATNYGGMTDYVTNKNGWLIDVERMIPAAGVPRYLYEHTIWAEPSIKHLRKAMREAYTNKSLLKKKGDAALKTAQQLTWDDMAKIVIKAFIK